MTPESAYQNAIENLGFISDPIQAEAVQLTQQLYQKLLAQPIPDIPANRWSGTVAWLREKLTFSNPPEAVKGLYFWGGVGNGKTWLVDSFFQSLPMQDKQRIHFHPFMQQVHQQLKHLPKTPDPLKIIARDMARKFRLLCIDEFHVQDITDAMLLSGLLEALFANGVTLVTTSNLAPDDLYRNGLQRERFIPAIQLIKQHTRVFELENKTDYRDLVLSREGNYHCPLNEHSADMMLQHYIQLSQHAPVDTQTIEINKRELNVLAFNLASDNHPANVIWFDFNELCNTHRSNHDYQIIAERFDKILIANIYRMGEQKESVAKRFMHLIDALYDNQCCLIISAEAEPDVLYHGRLLEMPFQRTVSRLKELRNKLYRDLAC